MLLRHGEKVTKGLDERQQVVELIRGEGAFTVAVRSIQLRGGSGAFRVFARVSALPDAQLSNAQLSVGKHLDGVWCACHIAAQGLRHAALEHHRAIRRERIRAHLVVVAVQAVVLEGRGSVLLLEFALLPLDQELHS